MSRSRDAVSAAFVAACRAELDVVKPGNVHRFAAGHGMDVALFEASAVAAAPHIADPNIPVGTRILRATEASWAAVGLNTNLGIVLLCAPLAAAAEHAAAKGLPIGPARLHEAVRAVLSGLGPTDARDAFAAIARASPGGLGDADEHDVRQPPAIGLVGAMRLAAGRDLVARQYSDGFAEIFGVGLPALDSGARLPERPEGLGPALDCFLEFATRFPDSHIGRKYGPDVAEAVRREFMQFAKRLKMKGNSPEAATLALNFDGELKRRRINPGTSADLTVASLFSKQLAEHVGG
ncbi:triphosphoribosyl-dephospho-CoA synthase [Jiella sp. M17.18]|uniref:triphosphoribosyl-dephospho-CoA synthase n=1 Tax=Jiella sp. M17.18 TaxID=3234247 RepID=UPI0034DEF101